MPTMVPDAFENYLAEVTALRIAEECKSNGMLAAAMHARHKVRKADLEHFFTKANGCDPKSWERKFYLYCLVVYAVAAYKDIDELCSAGKNCMGEVKIKPHWSKQSNKEYSFSSVIFYEPLNLFPGLSTENMSSNMKIIDEHKAAYYSDGTSKSVAMMAHVQRDKPTKNEIVAKRVSYFDDLQSASSATPATPPKQSTGVRFASTPISASLSAGQIEENIRTSKEIEEMTKKFDAARKHKMLHAKKINDQVKQLRGDAGNLNAAGISHYEDLLKNYNAAMAGLNSSDVWDIKKTLDSAKEKWAEYRSDLIKILEEFEAETEKEFPIK